MAALTPQPFAATLAKAKANGLASLSLSELCEWHADVYAYRRVRSYALEREKTSPLDPDGKYFHSRRIELVENWYRRRDRELHEFRRTPAPPKLRIVGKDVP